MIFFCFYSFDYQNEASCETSDKEESDEKTILLSTHDTHHIALEDITFYTEEFRICNTKTNEPVKIHDDTFSSALSDPYMSAISSDNEMFYSESGATKGDESESEENEDDATVVCRSEMLMFGKIMNRQEIRINMKLAENVESGPKVSLQMSIGLTLLFLSPRQMHMLILLCDILVNGESEKLKEASFMPRIDEKKISVRTKTHFCRRL
jgi:hypothetical protein